MKALYWWFLGFVCGALMTARFAVYVVGVLPEPVPEVVQQPQSEFGTTPPDCGHLYNVDKHKEWAACMGVGYITMRRDDI